MGKPLIDRKDYDHPEHFDDIIREYRNTERYIPIHLEDLLLEVSGHRCSVCLAPYCEIHHIHPLESGGETVYENLIVLCPNCHTRVHKENQPNQRQLLQYKMKQEISYELPVLSKLTKEEKQFILESIDYHSQHGEYLTFVKRFTSNIAASTQELAFAKYRRDIGYLYLEEESIIKAEYGEPVLRSDKAADGGNQFWINISIRLTGKGIKWIRYLTKSDRLDFLR